MAPNRKRRSDQLAAVGEASSDDSPPRQRRRPAEDSDDASESSSEPDTRTQTQSTSSAINTLIKKLVRMALSCEYSRTPIRRSEISTKVLGEVHARKFKPVFAGAQKVLADSFGMQMLEQPGREKIGLKERRAAASSQKVASSSSKSWVLVSTLPDGYKQNGTLLPPAKAPSESVESSYTAIYTFIISLIYLNNNSLPEPKMDRYLKRANADAYAPIPGLTTEKLLQRMAKEGYVEKRRDTSTGEEAIEWVVGPRGKIEVGPMGVQGLVRKVYGAAAAGEDGLDEDEQEDLDRRLGRSLGTLPDHGPRHQQEGAENGEEGDAD